jgi:hypothetical protein
MALDEGLRCRHGDGAPGCCCESVTWWCRSRQRSGSARSAELAWATPARRAPGRPAMVGGGGRGQDESDGSGGDSSKTTATSTSTTTTTEPPLRILVVHALDKVSSTQSPVSGLDDYDATFTVDITTEGTGTVSYQWAGAPPTPGPRRVRTRPAQGRQGRGPEPCLRARRQPRRQDGGTLPRPRTVRRGPGAVDSYGVRTLGGSRRPAVRPPQRCITPHPSRGTAEGGRVTARAAAKHRPEARNTSSTSTTIIPDDNPGHAGGIKLSKPCERSCARR